MVSDQAIWGGPAVTPPTLYEIRAAADRLKNVIVHTPLMPLHNYEGSRNILLKPETLQPVGSFKIRGVYNWVASLTPEERQRGLITFSAGNTAQALGLAAKLFDVLAHSVLPDYAPKTKVEAIRRYGVELTQLPSDEFGRYILEQGWRKEPYSFLNPWIEPRMIAGNGTIGLEILADLPNVDTVYVPVGGGGLIGGVGSAIKAAKPSVRVVGVEPQSVPKLYTAFRAGRPVQITPEPTICDGVLVPFITSEMYPLLRGVIDDVVLVPEKAVKAAIKRLALRNKLIVEGAGALSVAAALATKPEERGKAVCLVTGGSIDTDKLTEILNDPTLS
jgi:threonine dehydratase